MFTFPPRLVQTPLPESVDNLRARTLGNLATPRSYLPQRRRLPCTRMDNNLLCDAMKLFAHRLAHNKLELKFLDIGYGNRRGWRTGRREDRCLRYRMRLSSSPCNARPADP